MKIDILGTGCAKCKQLAENTKEALKELNINSDVNKITDINDITKYGVMFTPALVVNGKILFEGKIPDKESIKNFLK